MIHGPFAIPIYESMVEDRTVLSSTLKIPG